MVDIRLIRNRIRGIQNIAKITQAMEMAAASKMRRAQQAGLSGRSYAEKIHQVIVNLAALPQCGSPHPLLQSRHTTKIAIVHITPDRGLCGGLNANINRMTASFILEKSIPVTLIAVGRKGFDFMRRHGRDIRAEFAQLGDHPRLLETLPISRIIIDDYTDGFVDTVYLAYTEFVSTWTQRPVLRQLLPVKPEDLPKAQNVEYLYEPNHITVLEELLPRFVEMQVYHAILESIASEQSARMVAMRNATDNTGGLIQDLTLVYNKARQESITNDLLDISSGSAVIT